MLVVNMVKSAGVNNLVRALQVCKLCSIKSAKLKTISLAPFCAIYHSSVLITLIYHQPELYNLHCTIFYNILPEKQMCLSIKKAMSLRKKFKAVQ